MTSAPQTTGADPILSRPRLERRLDEIFGKRLTLVVAGAGYGKSTLVSSWAADARCAWHGVLPDDTELSALYAGIARAVESAVPTMQGLSVVSGASSAAPTVERSRAEALAASLAEELAERLEHDVVIVVDDAHLIAPETPAARFLEMLCLQAPEQAHLVILSRADPPFPIERMRTRGEVLELVADDLVFLEAEVDSLVRTTLGEHAASLAGAIMEITAGWPAVLRMVVERLRAATPQDWMAAIEGMRMPGGELFSYLADEVFGSEPPQVRELLLVAAEFPRVSVAVTEALGLDDAGVSFGSLGRRGLLLDASEEGEGWFRLHDLMRAFCLEEWGLPEDDRRRLHLRAAAWFAEHGYASDALRSLRLAGKADAMAAFIRDHGRGALPAAAQDLIEAAEGLPADLQDEKVALCLGEAHVAAGNLEEARAQLMKAAGSARELDAHLVRMLALTYYSDGDLGEAVTLFARANTAVSDPREVALMLALWSNIESLRGEIDHARALAQEAHAVATACGDSQARAHAYHALGVAAQLAGDGGAFLDHYRQAVRWADRAGDTVLAGRSRSNLVAELISDGRVPEALEDVARVIEDAELSGASVDRLPMLLTARGNALSAIGRFEEAIASFGAVTRLLEQRGGQHGAGHLLGLGDAYRERGDVVLARAAYERTIALADPMHNVIHLSLALSGLARVLAGDEPDEAWRLAERSLEEATGLSRVFAKIGFGWVALGRGDSDAARTAAAEAEVLARSRSHRAELAASLELRALALDDEGTRELLEDAAGIWRELDNDFYRTRVELLLARRCGIPDAQAIALRAERRLRASGLRIEAAARAAGLLAWLPAGETPVRLETLGGFRLIRDGKSVPTSEWRSKKARDLLKLVVAKGGRPVPREALMEALWPGQDPASLSNRFSVALSTIRSVLDPERRFPSDHHVRADLDAVSLANVPVDLDIFLAEARAGLAGDCERLEDAESLYAGDFLEEDAYEDWAISRREEARATYIEVAYALAERRIETGDLESAGRFLRRVLERDPYDERAHLELVTCLGKSAQHGQARRAYRGYTARMDEISVEPAPFPASR